MDSPLKCSSHLTSFLLHKLNKIFNICSFYICMRAEVYHFWKSFSKQWGNLPPWILEKKKNWPCFLITWKCLENVSCNPSHLQFGPGKWVENCSFPEPKLLLSKPQSILAFSNTMPAKLTSFIPHWLLTQQMKNEWKNKWRWTAYKNWIFYLFPSGASTPPSICKLIFLLDLGLQYTHSQSHSLPTLLWLLQEILWVILKTYNSLMRWKSTVGNLITSRHREIYLSQSLFPQHQSRDPEGITGSIRGSLSAPAAWWDQVHLLFSISIALNIHFSAPFCQKDKGQPFCSKMTLTVWGCWFTILCNCPEWELSVPKALNSEPPLQVWKKHLGQKGTQLKMPLCLHKPLTQTNGSASFQSLLSTRQCQP